MLYETCMKKPCPQVPFYARLSPVLGPSERVGSAHVRERAGTSASERHLGGTPQKTSELRRNHNEEFALLAAPGAQKPNENGVKLDFTGPNAPQWSPSENGLYESKYEFKTSPAAPSPAARYKRPPTAGANPFSCEAPPEIPQNLKTTE